MVIQRQWVSGVRALYLIETPCMINVGPTMHSVLRIVESLKAKDVGLKRVLRRMRLTCMKLFPKVCSSMQLNMSDNMVLFLREEDQM
jgi:hypothetical protein